MKHKHPKPLRCSKGGHKREVYNTTVVSQESRKNSDMQPNLMPKQIKLKASRTKEIIKISWD